MNLCPKKLDKAVDRLIDNLISIGMLLCPSCGNESMVKFRHNCVCATCNHIEERKK